MVYTINKWFVPYIEHACFSNRGIHYSTHIKIAKEAPMLQRRPQLIHNIGDIYLSKCSFSVCISLTAISLEISLFIFPLAIVALKTIYCLTKPNQSITVEDIKVYSFSPPKKTKQTYWEIFFERFFTLRLKYPHHIWRINVSTNLITCSKTTSVLNSLGTGENVQELLLEYML